MKLTKKNKHLLLGGLISLTALTLGVTVLTNTDFIPGIFARGTDNQGLYSLTLNSSNKVTSNVDAKHTITDNGVGYVDIKYNGVANSTTGHVTLNANGYINNVTFIRSIASVKATFTGDLSFKASYDNKTWNTSSAMTSGETYQLGSNPYFLYFSTSAGSTIESIIIKYTCVENPSAHEGEEAGPDEWQLATSVAAGDRVVIVSEYASNSKIEANNYKLSGISDTSTKYGLGTSYSSATSFETDYIYTVEAGSSNGSIAFKNSSNEYLYWNTGNSLELTSTKSNNTSWTLDFTGYNALVSNCADATRQLWWNSNTSGGQIPRFACYTGKTGTDNNSMPFKYVSFYKLVAGEIQYDQPGAYDTGFSVDFNSNMKEGDTFNSAAAVVVTASRSDNTTSPVTSQSTIKVFNYLNKEIDKTAAFTYSAINPQSNTYRLVVEYGEFIPYEAQFTVGKVQLITGIEATLAERNWTTGNTMSSHIEDDLDIALSFKYSEDDTYGVKYSGISTYSDYGLTVELLTPSGATYNMSTPFGTAGNWKIRVSAHNGTVVDETEFTVHAIPVTNIQINGTLTVEEGKTTKLTVGVTPEDATNKGVTWTSGNNSIATVDNDGLVTGVAEGETTITATAKDGSAVYGMVNIEVTEAVAPANWDIVKSESGLAAGDQFVIGQNTEGYLSLGERVTTSTAWFFNAVQATFSTNSDGDPYITTDNLPATAQVFTLGGTSGAWTIQNNSGEYLSVAASKKIEWSDSPYIWGTSTYDGYLYFTCTVGTEAHYLIYNPNSSGSSGPRITVYKGTNNGSMYYAQIYKGSTSKPVYATSINITGNNAISVGESSPLSVEYINSNGGTVNQKTTSWSSSNEAVATVSGGVVTGVSAGSARITATVVGKNNAEITNYIDITVSNVAVSGVSLNKSSASIKVNATVTLVATISPSNAFNKNVTWTSSNTSVATVTSGGVVTGKAAGSSTITVTTQNGGFTASCTVTVTAAAASSQWELVTDGSSLSDGDLIVIASSSAGTSAGTLSSQVLSSSSSSFEDASISELADDTIQFTLESSGDNWKLKNDNGQYLGATAVKKLAWNSGTQTWSISITSAGLATIQNTTESYGRFLCNTSTPRFTTYTSATSSSMLLPEIYRGGSAEPVSPTAISLSSSTLELTKGQTKNLTVNYTPAKANTNKEITWTSSSSSVATVSNGQVTANSSATVGTSATITARLTNVPSAAAVSCTVTIVDVQKDAWTIMIYMCGADLESDYADNTKYDGVGLATGDLNEICSVSGKPNDVNIIVQTGGASKWTSSKYGGYNISTTNLERYHVANKTLVKDDSLTYASMGQVSTFQSFLEWGLTEYPAEKTGVIMWNHGGAMKGVCYDEKSGDDNITNAEMQSALSGAFKSMGLTGQKLEFIGYDACLMQVQDIAETNSQYFNYMIASEESEAGYGWDYDTWVDDLYSKKATTTILKAIVDGFISDNGGANITTDQWGDPANQTLSYLTLSYAAAYKTAWENLATQLGNKITSSNKSSFTSLVNSCKHFADDSYTYYGTFDAKDFINKLKNNSTFNPGSSYTSAVESAFSNLVTYSVAQKGAGNAYGLCMFWSINSNCKKGTYYTASHTNFSVWRGLNNSYGA